MECMDLTAGGLDRKQTICFEHRRGDQCIHQRHIDRRNTNFAFFHIELDEPPLSSLTNGNWHALGVQEAKTVLEAYVFDPDVPENDLEVMLKANMGKQCLMQWQQGWLVLDDEEKVGGNTTVIV